MRGVARKPSACAARMSAAAQCALIALRNFGVCGRRHRHASRGAAAGARCASEIMRRRNVEAKAWRRGGVNVARGNIFASPMSYCAGGAASQLMCIGVAGIHAACIELGVSSWRPKYHAVTWREWLTVLVARRLARCWRGNMKTSRIWRMRKWHAYNSLFAIGR